MKAAPSNDEFRWAGTQNSFELAFITRAAVSERSPSSLSKVLVLKGPPSVYVSGRQLSGLHLVEQPPHPAVGNGRYHHACRLATAAQLGAQPGPPFVVTNQTMGRFDEHRPQLRIARLDQSRVRLPLAAGGIPRSQAAEARQLLAGAETIETANLRANRHRRDQADAGKRKEFLHE